MIPADITSQLQFLEAQVQQYQPLASAPRAGVSAMQLNAAALVVSVQDALVAPGNLLDTWTSSQSSPVTIAGLLQVAQAATDQSNLSLLRGIAGRVASNLNQLV